MNDWSRRRRGWRGRDAGRRRAAEGRAGRGTPGLGTGDLDSRSTPLPDGEGRYRGTGVVPARRQAGQFSRSQPLCHVRDGRGRGVGRDVRAEPGTDRSATCAAGAGLIHAAVGGVRKATGGVFLDDKKAGLEHHESAVGAGPGGRRNALPTRQATSKFPWKAKVATLMARIGGHPGNVG